MNKIKDLETKIEYHINTLKNSPLEKDSKVRQVYEKALNELSMQYKNLTGQYYRVKQ